jgi:hypothetical protein
MRTGAKSSIGTFVFTKKGQVIRFIVPSKKSKLQRIGGKDTEQYVISLPSGSRGGGRFIPEGAGTFFRHVPNGGRAYQMD